MAPGSAKPKSRRIARDQPVERRAFEPAGDPVAGLPVGAVRPDDVEIGKGRKGPRVPGPDEDVVRIDHAPAIDGRDRVVLGREAALAPDRSARGWPRARAPGRDRRARRGRTADRPIPRISDRETRSGRSAPLSTAGTPISVSQIGFDLRHPGGRRRSRRRRRARHARFDHQVDEILRAEDPRLAVGAVGDRRARLRARARLHRRSTSRRPRRRRAARADSRRRRRCAPRRDRAWSGRRASPRSAGNSRCRPHRCRRSANSGSSGKRTSLPPSSTWAPYSVQSARIDDLRGRAPRIARTSPRKRPQPRRPPDRRPMRSARASGRRARCR